MGIPQLFLHLSRAHPRAIRTLSAANEIACDRLYLDFNAMVHEAARAISYVIGRGPSDAEVIDETVESLRRVTTRLRPRSLVFIAVDGLPPRAKLHQQRLRRYMKSSNGNDDESFDSNKITPGTAFMKSLSVALHERAEQVVRSASSSRVRVVISDSDEPGEGEQKIFRDIREQSKNGERSVVYGLDADLMLLSMMHPLRDTITVCRELNSSQLPSGVEEGNHRLILVDIKTLALGVASRISVQDIDDASTLDARVADFVCLVLLLGNDFIPGLLALGRIRDGALDMLTAAYRDVISSSSMHVNNVNNNINGSSNVRRLASGGSYELSGLDTGVLAAILSSLEVSEGERLKDRDRAYFARCYSIARSLQHQQQQEMSLFGDDLRSRTPVSVQHNTTHNINTNANLLTRPSNTTPRKLDDEELYPALNPPARDAVRPGVGAAWRYRYYKSLFVSVDGPTAAMSYVSGLAWALAYMQGSCPSWGFHYEHAYAPTVLDLRNVLLDPRTPGHVSDTFEKADATNVRPPTTAATAGEWQLLLVLPPWSAHLLPKRLADIMTSPHTRHMYPREFRIGTYLRDKKHECCPVLPPIDLCLLRDAVVQ